MKIIDFERKGNAGKVYPKYISGYKDVIFGFDYESALTYIDLMEAVKDKE